MQLMTTAQKTITIASYFQDNYAKWDRLDSRAFIDVLTDLLTTYSTGDEWQSLALYQKWLRHSYGRFMPTADEVFTQGDYYQLVTSFISTLEILGIQ